MKRVVTVLTVLTMVLALSACGKKDTNDDIQETLIESESTEEVAEEVEEDDTDDIIEDNTDDEAEPVDEEETSSEESETASSESMYDYLFDEDLSLTIDGQEFTLPFAYAQLKDAGWVIEENSDEVSKMELDPGSKVKDIQVENKTYNEDFRVALTIKNDTNEIKNLEDCTVVGIYCDSSIGFSDLSVIDNIPEVSFRTFSLGDSWDKVAEALESEDGTMSNGSIYSDEKDGFHSGSWFKSDKSRFFYISALRDGGIIEFEIKIND